MAPLAPVITQTVTTSPVAGNTVVATLAQPGGETDPGPFTYALTTNVGGAFAVTGTNISTTATTFAGSRAIGAKATSAGGVSPEGTATLAFTDGDSPYDDLGQGYADNPQFPPAMAADETEVPWTLFIRQATTMVVPGARDGVDFAVARFSKLTPDVNVYWNDAVLGPRPDAEIEATARALAGASPYNTSTT